MNKDGVDDAHRVIVAGPHTLLWLVSLNEALWRLVRVFLLFRKTVLQFYVSLKKD